MSNILRFAQVRERTGLSRVTVYRRMRKGTFPAAIDLGDDSVQLGWIEAEIDEWVANRRRHIPRGHGAPKDEPAPEAAP